MIVQGQPKAKQTKRDTANSVEAIPKEHLTYFVDHIGRELAEGRRVEFFTDEARKAYATPEGRKAILEKAGINDKTGDDFRLVHHQELGSDNATLFRGSIKNGTLTLSEIYRVKHSRVDGPLPELPTIEFKKLPQPIVIKNVSESLPLDPNGRPPKNTSTYHFDNESTQKIVDAVKTQNAIDEALKDNGKGTTIPHKPAIPSNSAEKAR